MFDLIQVFEWKPRINSRYGLFEFLDISRDSLEFLHTFWWLFLCWDLSKLFFFNSEIFSLSGFIGVFREIPSFPWIYPLFPLLSDKQRNHISHFYYRCLRRIMFCIRWDENYFYLCDRRNLARRWMCDVLKQTLSGLRQFDWPGIANRESEPYGIQKGLTPVKISIEISTKI